MIPFAIDDTLLDTLTAKAKASERKRMHYDLRDSDDDVSMRMLNAIEPETVIPVHCHTMTSEEVIVLRGKAVEILYDEQGKETERVVMKPGSGCMACHVPMGQYHTCQSMESGTVIIEFKNTQYDPKTTEKFLYSNQTNTSDSMISNEITERVKTFIETEKHSCSPVLLTAENVARLCYITVEEAATALRELARIYQCL